jgi:hypothetical protein
LVGTYSSTDLSLWAFPVIPLVKDLALLAASSYASHRIYFYQHCPQTAGLGTGSLGHCQSVTGHGIRDIHFSNTF